MDEEIKKISNRIKEMRKARNITQRQLAEALDISVTNMCNIENGKTAVTMQNLIKMKGVFGCELKDFFIEEMEQKLETKQRQTEEAVNKPQREDKSVEAKMPESIDLQDAINLLRLLKRIDIKGI